VSFFATDLHRSGGRPEEVSSHLICRSGHPVRRGIRRPPSPRGLRREVGAPRVLLPLMQAVRTRNSIRLPIRTFAARGSHQLPQQERTFWSSQAGGIVAHVPSAHRRSECFSALSSTPASWTYRSKVFAESARLRAADPRGPVLPRAGGSIGPCAEHDTSQAGGSALPGARFRPLQVLRTRTHAQLVERSRPLNIRSAASQRRGRSRTSNSARSRQLVVRRGAR
jgi:hypothetical protein